MVSFDFLLLFLLDLTGFSFVILREIVELEYINQALSILISCRMCELLPEINILFPFLRFSIVILTTKAVEEGLWKCLRDILVPLLLIQPLLIVECLQVNNIIADLHLLTFLVPYFFVLAHQLKLDRVDEVIGLFIFEPLGFFILFVILQIGLHHFKNLASLGS